MASTKIIGLSGTNGSGKDTVGLLLAQKHNYLFISVTDLLRAECVRRGLSTDRENTRTISAEWRREFGFAVLVDRAVKTFQETGDKYDGLVMASLRNPFEADRIHELDGTMLWIDADPHARYARVQGNDRGRVEDNKTFEQFLADDQVEMHPTGDAATLNMSAVKDRCDITIVNDTADMDDLERSLSNALHLA